MPQKVNAPARKNAAPMFTKAQAREVAELLKDCPHPQRIALDGTYPNENKARAAANAMRHAVMELTKNVARGGAFENADKTWTATVKNPANGMVAVETEPAVKAA